MKNKNILLVCLTALILAACGTQTTTKRYFLKDVLGDKFLIGVALNTRQSSGVDTASVK